MKRLRCTALVVVAVSLLLAGCDSGDDAVFPEIRQLPPPTPLAWDQANWDEVVWQ